MDYKSLSDPYLKSLHLFFYCLPFVLFLILLFYLLYFLQLVFYIFNSSSILHGFFSFYISYLEGTATSWQGFKAAWVDATRSVSRAHSVGPRAETWRRAGELWTKPCPVVTRKIGGGGRRREAGRPA